MRPGATQPHKRHVAFQFAFVAAAVLAVVGMNPVASGASVAGGTAVRSTAPVADTFVGEVPNTSGFIAVVVSRPKGHAAKQKAVAYLCDGQKVSTWFFFGAASDNTFDLVSKSGGHVRATLNSSGVTGTVDAPGSGTLQFEAAPARGVAGTYLVNHSLNRVRGFSAARARLDATVTRASDNIGFQITGTVTPLGGTPVTIKASGTFLGSLSSAATWIVLADGRATGGGDPPEGGSAGSGKTCSVWAQIKSATSGVDCHFLARPRAR